MLAQLNASDARDVYGALRALQTKDRFMRNLPSSLPSIAG